MKNDLFEQDILGTGTVDVTITQASISQGSLPLQYKFDYLAYGQRPESKNTYTNLAINIRESL